MGDRSKIEWLKRPGTVPHTWPLVTGCTPVDSGCRNCFAARLAATRLKQLPQYDGLATMSAGVPRWTNVIRPNTEILERPFGWRHPRTVFVAQTGDLFHKDVATDDGDALFFIIQALAVMWLNPRHLFMVLTKRPDRASAFMKNREVQARIREEAIRMFGARELKAPTWWLNEVLKAFECASMDDLWPIRNVWFGTSVSDQKSASRLAWLMQIPAALHFVSVEPLLSEVDFSRVEINHMGQVVDFLSPPFAPGWLIVGGETGPGSRPMHPDWARGLRDQCAGAGVPFFFKSQGDWLPKEEALNILGEDSPIFRACSPSATGKNIHRVRMIGNETFVRVGKKDAGRKLDGVIHNEWPA